MARFACAALCAVAFATTAGAAAAPSFRSLLSKSSGLRGTATPGPLGWSAPGHEIIAAIATALLSDSAIHNVGSILPSSETLVSVSTWADDIKDEAEWKWTQPLHFINTPSWACKFVASTDCADSMCVYGAVLNFTDQLTTSSGTQQLDALKFVTHFVGDIHQPLHCGFLADHGGNDITGYFLDTYTNLHAVWDEGIIANRITTSFAGNQDSYVTYLLKQIAGPWAANATEWASCTTPGSSTCVNEWANESADLACTNAYVEQTGAHIASDFSLGSAYYKFTLPVVEMQLAKGGVRLANLLNNVWPASPAPPTADPMLASE